MRLDEIDRQPCSGAKLMAQIGDAWSMLILREALYGRHRFSDFVKYTGAQKTVVSAHLKALVEVRILERVEYSEPPTRHSYLLTDKGRDLAPVLFMAGEWGDKWLDDGGGRQINLTHTCGRHAAPTLVCGACREPLEADAVTPSIGPGYPADLPDLFGAVGA